MKSAEPQGFTALLGNICEVKVLYKIKVGEKSRFIIIDSNYISIVLAEYLSDFALDYDIRFKDKQEVIEYIEKQVRDSLNREQGKGL